MFKALLHLAKAAKQPKKGQGLVEYALILVLVAVVVIVILAQLGPGIGNIFSTVNSALQGNVAPSDDNNNQNNISFQYRQYTAPGTWSWVGTLQCGVPAPPYDSPCADPGPGAQQCYVEYGTACN